MKNIGKIHKTITLTQILITLISLSVSSLGIVIQHPILVYFWNLSLVSIASILATSFMIGVALLIIRIVNPRSSRGGPRGRDGWISRPKSIQA
jgi:CBS domain containing-hemolysin-like protein